MIALSITSGLGWSSGAYYFLARNVYLRLGAQQQSKQEGRGRVVDHRAVLGKNPRDAITHRKNINQLSEKENPDRDPVRPHPWRGRREYRLRAA